MVAFSFRGSLDHLQASGLLKGVDYTSTPTAFMEYEIDVSPASAEQLVENFGSGQLGVLVDGNNNRFDGETQVFIEAQRRDAIVDRYERGQDEGLTQAEQTVLAQGQDRLSKTEGFLWDADGHTETLGDQVFLTPEEVSGIVAIINFFGYGDVFSEPNVYGLPSVSQRVLTQPEGHRYFPITIQNGALMFGVPKDLENLPNQEWNQDPEEIPNPAQLDEFISTQVGRVMSYVTRPENLKFSVQPQYFKVYQGHPVMVVSQYATSLPDDYGTVTLSIPVKGRTVPQWMDLFNFLPEEVATKSVVREGVDLNYRFQIKTNQDDLDVGLEAIAQAISHLKNNTTPSEPKNEGDVFLAAVNLAYIFLKQNDYTVEEARILYHEIKKARKDDGVFGKAGDWVEGLSEIQQIILALIVASVVAGITVHEYQRFREFVKNMLVRPLDRYTTNMNEDITRKYQTRKLNPFVVEDRVAQIRELVELLRPSSEGVKKRAGLLIGPRGVGKTSIVEYLTYLIVTGEAARTPGFEYLVNVEFRYMDASDLSGKGKLSAGSDKVKALVGDIIKARKQGRQVVLVIDEIHALVDVDKHSNSDISDVAELLKKYIASGDLAIVGMTTDDEYRRHILGKNAPLADRFRLINVPPPRDIALARMVYEQAQTLERGQRAAFERTQDGSLRSPLLDTAIRLSEAADMNGKFEPRRTLDLLTAFVDAERAKQLGLNLPPMVYGNDAVQTPRGSFPYLRQASQRMGQWGRGIYYRVRPSAIPTATNQLPLLQLSTENIMSFLGENLQREAGVRGRDVATLATPSPGESGESLLMRRFMALKGVQVPPPVAAPVSAPVTTNASLSRLGQPRLGDPLSRRVGNHVRRVPLPSAWKSLGAQTTLTSATALPLEVGMDILGVPNELRMPASLGAMHVGEMGAYRLGFMAAAPTLTGSLKSLPTALAPMMGAGVALDSIGRATDSPSLQHAGLVNRVVSPALGLAPLAAGQVFPKLAASRAFSLGSKTLGAIGYPLIVDQLGGLVVHGYFKAGEWRTGDEGMHDQMVLADWAYRIVRQEEGLDIPFMSLLSLDLQIMKAYIQDYFEPGTWDALQTKVDEKIQGMIKAAKLMVNTLVEEARAYASQGVEGGPYDVAKASEYVAAELSGLDRAQDGTTQLIFQVAYAMGSSSTLLSRFLQAFNLEKNIWTGLPTVEVKNVDAFRKLAAFVEDQNANQQIIQDRLAKAQVTSQTRAPVPVQESIQAPVREVTPVADAQPVPVLSLASVSFPVASLMEQAALETRPRLRLVSSEGVRVDEDDSDPTHELIEKAQSCDPQFGEYVENLSRSNPGRLSRLFAQNHSNVSDVLVALARDYYHDEDQARLVQMHLSEPTNSRNAGEHAPVRGVRTFAREVSPVTLVLAA